MKALVFSDLHLAHHGLDYALEFPEDASVAIVAGDILAPVSESLRWLHAEVAARGIPVVYVAGNHEHYGQQIDRSLGDARLVRGHYQGVHWLENESVVLDGVRFLGMTLWTDYDLYRRPGQSMKIASMGLNDHRLIRTTTGLFQPRDALVSHMDSREWLERELSAPFDGRTVVVSHHGPHPGSIHRNYAGDSLNPAFVSDLSDILESYKPAVWIHGHVHSSFDYWVNSTRIVCNPRGYLQRSFRRLERENMDFEPFKMIDL